MGAEDLYEVIFDAEQEVKIEKKADIGIGTKTDQFVGFMSDVLEVYEADVALNGISQFTGEIRFLKNEYNKPYFEVISGAYVDSNLIYTTDDLSQSDELIYDNPVSGEKRALTINSLSDYSSRNLLVTLLIVLCNPQAGLLVKMEMAKCRETDQLME